MFKCFSLFSPLEVNAAKKVNLLLLFSLLLLSVFFWIWNFQIFYMYILRVYVLFPLPFAIFFPSSDFYFSSFHFPHKPKAPPLRFAAAGENNSVCERESEWEREQRKSKRPTEPNQTAAPGLKWKTKLRERRKHDSCLFFCWFFLDRTTINYDFNK